MGCMPAPAKTQASPTHVEGGAEFEGTTRVYAMEEGLRGALVLQYIMIPVKCVPLLPS